MARSQLTSPKLVRVHVWVEAGTLADLDTIVAYRRGRSASRSELVREACGWLLAREAGWLMRHQAQARDRERSAAEDARSVAERDGKSVV